MEKENLFFENEKKEEISLVENTKKYLLQINRIKLQNYLQQGLVAPDVYLDEEREIDIQSKNPHFLLLSNGYIDRLDEQTILIELILTQEETDKLICVGEVFYFNMPLPITRIKKVFVQSNEIRDHILKQIDISEKGFLPKRVFDVYQKRKKNIFDKFSYNEVLEGVAVEDYKNATVTFDKRMGMFAFMKNSEIYYADEKGYISNYSEHFFSVLAWFSENEARENIDFLRVLEQPSRFLKDFLQLDKQVDKEFIQEVSDEINDASLKECFLGILQPNNTVNTMKELLQHKNKRYFFVALLYYFRDRNSNRKDSFKINIRELIPCEYAEEALAILGIFLGYTRLRAAENFEITDKYFNKIFKTNQFNLKFTLENKLDYILIERLYQYCFHNKKCNEFDYLEYPNQRSQFSIPKDNFFEAWYDVRKEMKFGTEYIQIERKSFEDIFKEHMQKYPDKIILGKDYLYSYVAKYHTDLIELPKYDERFILYVDKERFVQQAALETNLNRQQELIRVFDMDKK